MKRTTTTYGMSEFTTSNAYINSAVERFGTDNLRWLNKAENAKIMTQNAVIIISSNT
jgi:hypothetical protein